ncbi:hypothetical protein J7J08_01090 [Stenotrophomonas sp. ISL-67]|uniref:hypothetical protein n=1 Tax=Stenotrophomonas sp. ISL-67 TaxID=2819171 RepID=UPI001BE9BE5E|nr:hypothetical protein [Stenotrophomonas sp. ISL-67]MBT2766229.1 hypothetical protein [Stenotrophomonas sp. ISL-67]
MIARFIETRAKRYTHLNRDVQLELAKVDLARGNQWLVGTFIASIPALGLMFAFTKAYLELPQFKVVLIVGIFASAFVVLTGPILCFSTRKDAIRRLSDLCTAQTADASPHPNISDEN